MNLDRARIVGFDWDAGNARKNDDAHGVSQREAEQAFFNEPLLVVGDENHGEAEPRWHALGRTDEGRPLQITFMLRQDRTLIRMMSARDMSRKERRIYAKADEEDSTL